MARLTNNLVLITRYTLGLAFLLAGVSMIDQYALAQIYVISVGLPQALLPVFIIVVIAGAVFLFLGSSLHWAALAMALLAVIAALLLPDGFADDARAATFFRNISIASVLLLMVAGCWGTGSRAARARRAARIKHTLFVNRGQ